MGSGKKKTGYIVLLAAAALAVILGSRYERAWRMQQEIAGKVVRFHVIANSDSARDQKLKLMVRDAIGEELSAAMAGAETKEECEEIIASHLAKIEETAETVLRREGCEDEVQAFLDDVNFPVKSYGCVTFPAGRYEALEVVIGEGEGHNWWCVMYPNLCFSGSVYEVEDDKAGEALREVLTEEEYREVISSGDYEVRFRYLSYLNEWME